MRKRKARPTIKDVALAAGVSRTTASYVISGSVHSSRISQGAKKRIMEAAASLGYRRNSNALALQRGYSNILAFLNVSWDLAAAHTRTSMQVSRSAAASGLMTIVHVAASEEEVVSFLSSLTSLNPFGLLLLCDSSETFSDQIREVSAQNIPVVDLMPGSTEDCLHVTSDRIDGILQCMRHLIGLGHKKIGYIIDTKYRWRTSLPKLEGYKMALQEAGLPFEQDLLEEVSAFGFDAGYDGIRNLLKRRPDVSAVLCINDAIGVGVIASAQDMGLSVPKDLSVIGYGNSAECEYVRPALTTIEPPNQRIADLAIERVVQLRKGIIPDGSVICGPMKLIIRNSTGKPRQ